MDVQAIGGERTLRRIVALLVALAVLAERAAVRSAPIRWLVLLILRRAETAAEAFVFDATGTPPIIEAFATGGNGREDALRLAGRFRALASVLSALLPAVCRLDRRSARRGIASGHVATGSGRSRGGRKPIPNDTS